jgi:hypothetical protein
VRGGALVALIAGREASNFWLGPKSYQKPIERKMLQPAGQLPARLSFGPTLLHPQLMIYTEVGVLLVGALLKRMQLQVPKTDPLKIIDKSNRSASVGLNRMAAEHSLCS